MNLLSRLGKGSENHSIQNFIPGEPMFTLTKGHHHAVAQLVSPIPIQDTRPMEKKQNGLGIGLTGDVAYTLDTTGAQGVAHIISPTITTCKGSKAGSSSEAIDELIAIHKAMNEEEPITFQPGNLRRKAGAAPSTEVFPTLKCDTGDQSPHIAYTENPECAAFKSGQGAASRSIGYSETLSPTLAANAGGNTTPAVMAPTLTASNDPSRSPQSSEVTAQVNSVHQVTMAVRRLTPRECERLQGFPDDWSQIPWKGKPASECPDGPRYKACGNSMAVPCMRWIGEGIDKKHKELFG